MGRKTGNPKLAVGYIRVSTDEQNLGPGAQREALERWCAANGAELVDVFEDHGVSGGAEIDKRPGLLAALDALKDTGAGLLVAAKRDRVARDVVVAAMVERLAEREGARVVTADGVGDGQSPEAGLLRGIVDVFAQYERALIRSRTKTALAHKKAKRERTGGIPYGWKLDRDGVHLVPEPNEKAIIEAAVTLRGEGLALRAIGERLEARGLLPRSGGRWHAKTVRSLLHAQAA